MKTSGSIMYYNELKNNVELEISIRSLDIIN